MPGAAAPPTVAVDPPTCLRSVISTKVSTTPSMRSSAVRYGRARINCHRPSRVCSSRSTRSSRSSTCSTSRSRSTSTSTLLMSDNGRPWSAGIRLKTSARARGEQLDERRPIEEHRPDFGRVDQILDVVVRLGLLLHVDLQFLVDGAQLLVERLELLFAHLELLRRRSKLLVHGLELFVRGFQLFGLGLVLLHRRAQLRPDATNLFLQLAGGVHGTDWHEGRDRRDAASGSVSSNSTRKNPRAGSPSRRTGRISRLTPMVPASTRTSARAPRHWCGAGRPDRARCAVPSAVPVESTSTDCAKGLRPRTGDTCRRAATGARSRAPR